MSVMEAISTSAAQQRSVAEIARELGPIFANHAAEATDEDQENSGEISDSEPQDGDRDPRDAGNRIERLQHRPDDLAGPPHASDQQSERDGRGDAQAESDHGVGQAGAAQVLTMDQGRRAQGADRPPSASLCLEDCRIHAACLPFAPAFQSRPPSAW